MGGRSVADIPGITQPQTTELGSQFGQARENAGQAFGTAQQDLSQLVSSQRQNTLADFAGQQQGQRQQALSTLPSNLRQSGVGQSAISSADRAASANQASVQRGITQTGLQAEQGLINQQLGSTLGLDQAEIQGFLSEIQSFRAAQAGLGGAKIASDTAASTGGLFGNGGFLGLGF